MFYFLKSIKFKNSNLDLWDSGHIWTAKNHQDLIDKIESFTNQKIVFIKYQKTILNDISCIDTFNY